ncbi:putative cysteine-rich receptor-like protein kinase 39 [Zingiber officinale]|uniref:putative cysteine-rich receptor-like protein kinase 39 n=1 Tax=Zingiber officinale TaxID=94328 RepID=UPI001C4D227C|nr:putative cysteine-rich receptor-like protein kinase 39 [Zingiber officinale]
MVIERSSGSLLKAEQGPSMILTPSSAVDIEKLGHNQQQDSDARLLSTTRREKRDSLPLEVVPLCRDGIDAAAIVTSAPTLPSVLASTLYVNVATPWPEQLGGIQSLVALPSYDGVKLVLVHLKVLGNIVQISAEFANDLAAFRFSNSMIDPSVGLGSRYPETNSKRGTDDFDDGQVLGRRGYSVVFKGILEPGHCEVTIKRTLIPTDSQSDRTRRAFLNEIYLLSQINHKNVVLLNGCCFAKQTPLLVYEFVPNGSLFALHHKKNGFISLEDRREIAEESAEVLAHLHSFKPHPIVNGDVKPSNIL